MAQKTLTVIGGGIIGLATAYQAGKLDPKLRVTVLEKEKQVGRHQTGNNSGVLHAGLYYKPGSAKAKLAVTGIQEMISFCKEYSIPHEICGKIVVAFNEAEVARLKDLLERGTQNGLQGLEWLNIERMREIEPHVGGIAAVRVPQEGIVDYAAVCKKLVELLHQRGDHIVTEAQVTHLFYRENQWIAETSQGEFKSDAIINCAGLQCDRIAKMSGEKPEAKIVPFRGEYYMLRKEKQNLVKHLIYPVPDPQFPFLGVHFTRMIHGGVECGPNAVLAFAREGYKMTDFNLADFAESLTYKGLWKFLAKYPSMTWSEFRRSLSPSLFCESLQKLIPEIQLSDLERGGAGVRAQALLPDGTFVQDFNIVKGKQSVHILNAPSPGATSSLAIGREVFQMLQTVLN